MSELHTFSAFSLFVKYLKLVISTWIWNSILFYPPKKCVLSIYLLTFSFLKIQIAAHDPKQFYQHLNVLKTLLY